MSTEPLQAEQQLEDLADRLVESDWQLLDDLIELRRRKLTQQQVAELLGIDQGSVARFESGERDPHLSTLRRYALAIGAFIEHRVTDAEDGTEDINRQPEKREINLKAASAYIDSLAAHWEELADDSEQVRRAWSAQQ